MKMKIRTLVDKSSLKLVQELKRKLVLVGQSLLTDDGLHGGGITTNGVLGVELVGNIRVVATGELLTDGRLHETGQGGQDVDGRVDTLVVKLTVNEDLALGDVTGKIGNGVGDICRWSSACRRGDL